MKSKKIRIFIYSLVAWFVGMAVIVYDFAVSYATSYSEDIQDAEIKFYDDEWTLVSEPWEGYISDFDVRYPVNSEYSSCKYSENMLLQRISDLDFASREFSLYSDSEIVCVIADHLSQTDYDKYMPNASSSMIGKCFIFLVSDSIIYSSSFWDTQRNGTVTRADSSYDKAYNEKWHPLGKYVMRIDYNYPYRFAIGTGKMKVFSSLSDADNYFETGDTSNMAWQGKSKEYDGDNIYLTDFQMIVHDSNAYSAYYLEFKYTIPEQLRDASSLQLQIEEQYDWTITGLSSLVTYPRTFSGNDYIDLLQYPTGFKLYLDDINVISQSITDIPIASTVSRRAVIGSELAFDTSGISIGGLGGETIVKVTNSKLYLTCYVIANNKFGVNYTGTVDFVSGSNDMSSFTPDNSGNYNYNGDLKNQGHYYTDVSTDAAGNVTYNYYYYGDDNSKTEISAKDSADNTLTVVPVPGQSGSIINNITIPDHIFVNVSGSSGGSSSGSDVGNVTIEDDDLSFDSLRESIKDGYGLIDDTDTGAKGDGLIAMLSDLFGYLPAKFVGLIMLGTSSVVGIAVLRMIFKR